LILLSSMLTAANAALCLARRKISPNRLWEGI
jgi:hypothetical protein